MEMRKNNYKNAENWWRKLQKYKIFQKKILREGSFEGIYTIEEFPDKWR